MIKTEVKATPANGKDFAVGYEPGDHVIAQAELLLNSLDVSGVETRFVMTHPFTGKRVEVYGVLLASEDGGEFIGL